jgi:hypothetical protein
MRNSVSKTARNLNPNDFVKRDNTIWHVIWQHQIMWHAKCSTNWHARKFSLQFVTYFRGILLPFGMPFCFTTLLEEQKNNGKIR